MVKFGKADWMVSLRFTHVVDYYIFIGSLSCCDVVGFGCDKDSSKLGLDWGDEVQCRHFGV